MVCAQGIHFALGEMTPCARGQPGQPDGPDAHAGQLGNRVADRGQHAAHLSVAPFKDRQFYLCPAVVF